MKYENKNLHFIPIGISMLISTFAVSKEIKAFFIIASLLCIAVIISTNLGQRKKHSKHEK